MAKKATKAAIEQLQRVFNILGKYGGTIETKKPDTWWTLDLEVEQEDESSRNITIGIFDDGFYSRMYDPKFNLTLRMDGDQIVEAEIHRQINQTLMGLTEIDSNDMLHCFGMKEKAPTGLRNSFSVFMDAITERGPYLKDPQKITKYNDII